MIKRREIADARSCWNKAKEDEMIFVLLARDPAFAATLEFWANERIRLGKNEEDDPQIKDALRTAEIVRNQVSK